MNNTAFSTPPTKNHSMKPSLKIITIAMTMSTTLISQSAHAEHDDIQCPNIPKEQMKSQQELHKQLTSEGWRVRQIKVTNGCYEVYGFDEMNAKVEVFFNPKTFEYVQPVKAADTVKSN